MKSRKMKKILIAVFATLVLALFSIGGLSCDDSSSGVGTECSNWYTYGSCYMRACCDYDDCWYETDDGYETTSAYDIAEYCY